MMERDMSEHQRFIKSAIDHIAKGGEIIVDMRPRRSRRMIAYKLEMMQKIAKEIKHGN